MNINIDSKFVERLANIIRENSSRVRTVVLEGFYMSREKPPDGNGLRMLEITFEPNDDILLKLDN